MFNQFIKNFLYLGRIILGKMIYLRLVSQTMWSIDDTPVILSATVPSHRKLLVYDPSTENIRIDFAKNLKVNMWLLTSDIHGEPNQWVVSHWENLGKRNNGVYTASGNSP